MSIVEKVQIPVLRVCARGLGVTPERSARIGALYFDEYKRPIINNHNFAQVLEGDDSYYSSHSADFRAVLEALRIAKNNFIPQRSVLYVYNETLGKQLNGSFNIHSLVQAEVEEIMQLRIGLKMTGTVYSHHGTYCSWAMTLKQRLQELREPIREPLAVVRKRTDLPF